MKATQLTDFGADQSRDVPPATVKDTYVLCPKKVGGLGQGRLRKAAFQEMRRDDSFSNPPSTGVFFLGPRVSIFNFNGLVHCVSADRAPTCLVADRRKTKPSDREARVRLGDHDPPTPRDKAEGSARALGDQARDRDQLHAGLWPL
jgi:hypothetical protein